MKGGMYLTGADKSCAYAAGARVECFITTNCSCASANGFYWRTKGTGKEWFLTSCYFAPDQIETLGWTDVSPGQNFTPLKLPICDSPPLL